MTPELDKEYYVSCPILGTEVHTWEEGLAFCSFQSETHGIEKVYPIAFYKDSMERTVSDWVFIRDRLIRAIKNGEKCACTDCKHLKEAQHPKERKIFSLSSGDSILCQLSCIYCTQRLYTRMNMGGEQKRRFDWVELLTALEKFNLMSEDATVCFALGEVTISPRKDELLDMAEKYNIHVLTNGVVFDDRIAMLTARAGGGYEH